MKKKLYRVTNRIAVFILVVTVLIPLTLYAQSPGNPVSISPGNQQRPVVAADGSGGTIIAWQDRRNGKSEIFVQRMSADGNPMWQSNGLPVCVQDSNFLPAIISDGTGGVIISWSSYRGSSTADIYIQKVSSSGAMLWTTNGVSVCTVVFEQNNISMISDGLGGAILTWQDYRSNNGSADVYAQRVNLLGTILWGSNGTAICNEASSQIGPKMVSDGSAGAFITWADNRAGDYDIYTQRIAAGGAVQWTTNGVATCTMGTDQLQPDVCRDGADGIIITWSDFRSTTDFNIYAQRVGPSGAIVWVVDGVVINNNVAYAQVDPKIVSDELSGAIITWTDYRTGITSDIYAQRISPLGAVQWTATGVIICTAVGDQTVSQLTIDGNNGAYITWEDHRNAGNSDIYAQRIASNSALNWSADGFEICTMANNQGNPAILSNGSLGAIVVWEDFRSGSSFDIYEVGFNTTGIIAVENEVSQIPYEYNLFQNYPNPFNPSTTISFQIPETGNVKISIFDILGRLTDIPLNEVKKAGNYNVVWNALNLPSGVYIYKIEAGSFTDVRKMILIK
ncbi:MAG: T9SS type A sorting domain-containing protein [Ignavibacteria bacterium]|nr:T9SS type A sorting domain-containing protein [Ignavibacteria bacterium]